MTQHDRVTGRVGLITTVVGASMNVASAGCIPSASSRGDGDSVENLSRPYGVKQVTPNILPSIAPPKASPSNGYLKERVPRLIWDLSGNLELKATEVPEPSTLVNQLTFFKFVCGIHLPSGLEVGTRLEDEEWDKIYNHFKLFLQEAPSYFDRVAKMYEREKIESPLLACAKTLRMLEPSHTDLDGCIAFGLKPNVDIISLALVMFVAARDSVTICDSVRQIELDLHISVPKVHGMAEDKFAEYLKTNPRQRSPPVADADLPFTKFLVKCKVLKDTTETQDTLSKLGELELNSRLKNLINYVESFLTTPQLDGSRVSGNQLPWWAELLQSLKKYMHRTVQQCKEGGEQPADHLKVCAAAILRVLRCANFDPFKDVAANPAATRTTQTAAPRTPKTAAPAPRTTAPRTTKTTAT